MPFTADSQEDRLNTLARSHRQSSRFNTARRIIKVLDLVSHHEGITAKVLARKLGVSLSTCYCLIDILVEEGLVEKIAQRKGYRLGPTVCALHARARTADIDARVEPAVEDLAARSGRHAYLGLLTDGEASLTRVETPCKKPPVAVVDAASEASHALAIGKILIAASGRSGLEGYVEDFGLKAFTGRTITDPAHLETHLAETMRRGFATDLEEFTENLCCVAAPIFEENGRVCGAIGLSTTARHFYKDSETLINLVSKHAEEASTLLG